MKHTLIDIRGQRFGLWLVVGTYTRVGNKTLWLCRCDCGTERRVNAAELRNGKSTNCGCVRKAKGGARNATHGLSHTRMHARWMGMIARCENPNHSAYARYGGRGVRVCRRWRKSFTAWLADMGPPPTPRHTIDRIDNDDDYKPSNCRWATNKANCRNKKTSQFIEWGGERLHIAEWAERLGMSQQTLVYRITFWSLEKAFTTPVRLDSRNRPTAGD